MDAGGQNPEQRLAELETALRQRERQIEAISRTSDALFSHTNVDNLVRETLLLALDVLSAEAGTLYLYDPAADTLVFRYVVGPAAESLTGHSMPASQGIAGQVFRTGVPDLSLKVGERGHFNSEVDKRSGYRTESSMTVPVKRPSGDPIGVMQILNARAGDPFDHFDLEVLEALCAQAAAAIEQARLLQQARKAEVANVIGDISHDIKNMLTPIQTGVWMLMPMLDQMFSDLDAIRARCPDAEPWVRDIERVFQDVRSDYPWILQNALEAADQVQARTKEIADAVKGELAPPHFEDADLNDTAREVARTLRPVGEKADVRLHLDLDEALPRLRFDRKQMYNALYNLVYNAIPETPAGGQVTVRTRGPGEGEDTLLVEVQDTGRGIPEHVRKRLFTDEVPSTKPGGTGLGTRIVAGVVRRHNGTITVQSEEGKGATFSIRLPLRPAP
uniref:histidine kinase n=1 Tax=uncultured Armatimonadetes bacterium TaxID=157466 RepID=A0A6J4HP35_9BACT|nr:hypothetical protein AVDCRST_MAG63-944 [uncultured Armatimonadetes bacterium]